MSGKIHPQNRLVEDRLKTALDLRVQRLVVAGKIPVAGARGRFDQAELPDIAGELTRLEFGAECWPAAAIRHFSEGISAWELLNSCP